MKGTRVQLQLPKEAFNRLTKLKKLTEAVSYAEVIKNALKQYEKHITLDTDSQGG